MDVFQIVRRINAKCDRNHSRLDGLESKILLVRLRYSAAAQRREIFACFTGGQVEKIPEVESAKALMTEAVAWSVMKWLREKKMVRKAADQANAALDQLDRTVKDRWPDEVRVAYEALTERSAGNSKGRDRNASNLPATDAHATL